MLPSGAVSTIVLTVGLVWLIGSPDAAVAITPPHPSRGLQLLEEIQTAITDLAERVQPSVVSIYPVQTNGKWTKDLSRDRLPNAAGTGAGLIVESKGFIVTNNHVVGDATEVEIRLWDKSKMIAQVVGKDQDTDLAVLKVKTDRQLPAAHLGDSNRVKVGQWVLAVGNPFGLDRTVTLGVVSGIGRENMNLSRYENFIQTDASINPGNSGGPLFNLQGEVVGINTAIINFAQGIGFAIPSNMAKQVVDQLITQGKVVRGWLGVGIQALTHELAAKFGVQEGEGVLVNEVFEHDPASRSGIKAGDVITKINDRVVDSPNALSRLVAGIPPGGVAYVEVVRDRQRQVIGVALIERKDAPVRASLPSSHSEVRLGLDVQDLTADLAEKFKLKETRGVLIAKVESGSLAQGEGLREGDLVKEVNRAEVNAVADFSAAVAKVRHGETVLLRIQREGRAFYVVLRTVEK